MSFFSRCLRYLSPAPFDSPAMEQQYAAHRTEGVRFRCLKHMLSYTLASLLLALSFRGLLASPSLSGWTFRIQLAAVLIAALIYGLMYAAHKQDGAASKLLREYNNAAQTIPAVYVCMVAPVLEPYRLHKLLGSSYAENVARWAQPLYDDGEWTSFVSSPRVKEVCGGWTPGEERACFFNSYEALVMTFIVYVVASAAVFGRTLPAVLTLSDTHVHTRSHVECHSRAGLAVLWIRGACTGLSGVLCTACPWSTQVAANPYPQPHPGRLFGSSSPATGASHGTLPYPTPTPIPPSPPLPHPFPTSSS